MTRHAIGLVSLSIATPLIVQSGAFASQEFTSLTHFAVEAVCGGEGEDPVIWSMLWDHWQPVLRNNEYPYTPYTHHIRSFIEYDISGWAALGSGQWSLSVNAATDENYPTTWVYRAAVYAYQADGIKSADDFNAGSLIATVDQSSTNTPICYFDVDVTETVSNAITSGWTHLGISLRLPYPGAGRASLMCRLPGLSFTPVPEPGTLLLLALGGLVMMRRRG